MVALTNDRMTSYRSAHHFQHPVAAGATIYSGALVMLDASGNAVPASTATGLTVAGKARFRVDNAGGSAGDEVVEVERGCFRYANDGTDTVDRSHIGGSSYAVDDQTVASTDGSGTRSACGIIRDVESTGVWIEF